MKMFVSDYDMTIYINRIIDDSVISAIKKWREAHNIFVIATGRNMHSILEAVYNHNIEFDYIIANNGSLVFNNKKEVLLKNTIEENIAYDVINFIYSNYDGALEFTTDKYNIAINGRDNNFNINHEVDKVIDINDIKLYKNIIQINKLIEDEKNTKTTANIINEQFKEVIAYPNIRYIDIVPKNISKASGIYFLEELLKKENKNISDIFVAGDSNNDIDMIKKYDGYVQINAKEDIKAITNKYFNFISDIINKNL